MNLFALKIILQAFPTSHMHLSINLLSVNINLPQFSFHIKKTLCAFRICGVVSVVTASISPQDPGPFRERNLVKEVARCILRAWHAKETRVISWTVGLVRIWGCQSAITMRTSASGAMVGESLPYKVFCHIGFV